MNRTYFFVMTGLCSLVTLLVIANIFLARSVGSLQGQTSVAQGDINQAQNFQTNLRQLALRIYQDAQKTQDAGLKDIVSRQQITFTPQASTNGTETPAPPTH
jgi:hypothetical protein